LEIHPHPDSQGEFLELLSRELCEGLRLYWQTAGRILAHSGVHLADAPPDYFAPQRNFFSALFLYSYYRQGIAPGHRVFYAAVNQSLRGMVTGCDNLLDGEYKMTLDTDLPAGGIKFRSILDIMVSDRVLFEILLDFCTANGKSLQTVTQAVTASLHALLLSGAQEASEEAGVTRRLTPQQVLTDVHHLKTGLLFLSPWAVPAIIEGDAGLADSAVTHALYQIGMGCQIMDDMVDLPADVGRDRHNYVASLIAHGPDSDARRVLNACKNESPAKLYAKFPDLFTVAHQTALTYLKHGLSGLYLPQHQFLLEPALTFISERIGVDRIAPAASAG
jgi:hypothetical protein